MQESATTMEQPKRLLVSVKSVLILAAGLVLIAGTQLFVFPENTKQDFAWTIKSPITAAFMGAAYYASFVLVVGGARQRYWTRARISLFSPMAFTFAMLIASLQHLDAFHFNDSAFFPRFAAWAWMVVYVVVPPLEAVVLYLQLRAPGIDLPRTAPMPAPVRWTLRAQAAIMLVLGAALFVVPAVAAPLWPWKLTLFTAQVTGGWLLGFGVAAVQAARENDWTRIGAACASYGLIGLLELVAVARFPAAIDWAQPAGWIYVAFLVSIVIVSGVSLSTITRLRTQAQ